MGPWFAKLMKKSRKQSLEPNTTEEDSLEFNNFYISPEEAVTWKKRGIKHADQLTDTERLEMYEAILRRNNKLPELENLSQNENEILTAILAARKVKEKGKSKGKYLVTDNKTRITNSRSSNSKSTKNSSFDRPPTTGLRKSALTPPITSRRTFTPSINTRRSKPSSKGHGMSKSKSKPSSLNPGFEPSPKESKRTSHGQPSGVNNNISKLSSLGVPKNRNEIDLEVSEDVNFNKMTPKIKKQVQEATDMTNNNEERGKRYVVAQAETEGKEVEGKKPKSKNSKTQLSTSAKEEKKSSLKGLITINYVNPKPSDESTTIGRISKESEKKIESPKKLEKKKVPKKKRKIRRKRRRKSKGKGSSSSSPRCFRSKCRKLIPRSKFLNHPMVLARIAFENRNSKLLRKVEDEWEATEAERCGRDPKCRPGTMCPRPQAYVFCPQGCEDEYPGQCSQSIKKDKWLHLHPTSVGSHNSNNLEKNQEQETSNDADDEMSSPSNKDKGHGRKHRSVRKKSGRSHHSRRKH